MTWIASYLRISEDPFKLEAGVGRQRIDNAALAAARWPDREVREYVDNDISASRYTTRIRPDFKRLCEDIENGNIYAMVGWDFDRVFRKPSELETFLDLCDRVQFTRAVTAQGDVDLTTNDGKLHARIMVAVAAKESDDKSRRVKRALQDRDEKGVHRGGKVVFGYVLHDGVPRMVPAQVTAVLGAYDKVMSGVPLREVARSMPAGAPHTGTGIKRMLLSPTLTGRTTSGARGSWEPVLTDVQVADLRARFGMGGTWVPAPTRARVWWLSGLVRCGICDTKLRVTHDRGMTNYHCIDDDRSDGDKRHISIRAANLHWHVEAAMFSFIEARERVRPRGTGGVNPQPRLHVVAELDAEVRLTELATLYATGAIGRAEWEAARAALIKEHHVPPSVLRPVADLAAKWDDLLPSQRHQHAKRVIEWVKVHPRVRGGARWQPDRVSIRWIQ